MSYGSRLNADARRISAALAWQVEQKRLSVLPTNSPLAREPARDAARFLDDCLAVLGREEARLRLVLGRLLAVFGRKAALSKLGFIRMSDYARERLGISGSEADTAQRVAKRLEALPLLREAFLDGRVSWTKVRILVATATADTEARWLELAARRTVRELEKLVADEGATEARGMATVREDDDVEIDGEPPARFRARAPGWAWLFFRKIVELARAVSGEASLPTWAAVEAITAEGLGTAGAAAFTEDIEAELSWLASRRRRISRPSEPWSPFLGKVVAGSVDLDTLLPGIARRLGVAEHELRRLLPEATYDETIDEEALTPIQLDARLRSIVAHLRTLDARIGRALRFFAERDLPRELGFVDLDAYVTERLGIGLRKARSLIALARVGVEHPAFRAAYEDGRLSWVRALALLPVIRDGTACEPWIERAAQVPVRRLVDEVSWSLEENVSSERPPLPPPLGGPLEPVQMRVNENDEKLDHVIEFWGPASVVANVERLAVAWSEPNEPLWKGLVRLLAAVARQWLAEGRRYRNRIVSRDGYRCNVPCCGSRRNLHVHHLVFRSLGGGDEDWNLGAPCAGHHHQCIHRYRVVARGRAPDAIEWTFGAAEPDGPLMRIRGEVYVTS